MRHMAVTVSGCGGSRNADSGLGVHTACTPLISVFYSAVFFAGVQVRRLIRSNVVTAGIFAGLYQDGGDFHNQNT